MQRVRLALLAMAMFFGITTVAQAQDQPGRGNRPNMSAMLLKDITLSTAQQAKVDSINAKYRDQMMALRNEGGDRETMMSKRRDLMEKQRDEIKAVLTDDQKKTFDKNVEDMRANMGNRRPPSDR